MYIKILCITLLLSNEILIGMKKKLSHHVSKKKSKIFKYGTLLISEKELDKKPEIIQQEVESHIFTMTQYVSKISITDINPYVIWYTNSNRKKNIPFYTKEDVLQFLQQ